MPTERHPPVEHLRLVYNPWYKHTLHHSQPIRRRFRADCEADTPSPDDSTRRKECIGGLLGEYTFSTRRRRGRDRGTHTTDDTVEPLLEPRDSVILLNLVLETDSAVLVLPSGNSGTGSSHNNVAEITGSIGCRATSLRSTHKSIPKIPIPGSYLIPKSMCSSIPKPKLPVCEKFLFFNSYSLTFNARSKTSSALGPRMVT